jgi:hypothetical protein
VLSGKEGTGLSHCDDGGHTRVGLGVVKNMPKLGLSDAKGKVRANLLVGKDGPALNLSDETGTIRSLLGGTRTITAGGTIVPYPESSLILFKPDGKVLWQAPP